jgi:hypothetical protein
MHLSVVYDTCIVKYIQYSTRFLSIFMYYVLIVIATNCFPMSFTALQAKVYILTSYDDVAEASNQGLASGLEVLQLSYRYN